MVRGRGRRALLLLLLLLLDGWLMAAPCDALARGRLSVSEMGSTAWAVPLPLLLLSTMEE